MGLQKVEHDWATELNWTVRIIQWYIMLDFIYILMSHKNRSEKQCGSISNSTDFEGKQRVWIYHFLTVWPWVNYLTLLSLSILIHKIRIIMSISQGHVNLKKMYNLKIEKSALFGRLSEGFKPRRQHLRIVQRDCSEVVREKPGDIRVFATKNRQ